MAEGTRDQEKQMKLTDFIQGVGQPVAYYPKLRKITGGVTASILLCQFIYWRGKERDQDGWLYKTSSEIEDETGLTYNEQKTARTLLKDAGLIEEHYARLDHKIRFRVNLEAVNEEWRKTETVAPESDNSTMVNDTKSPSLNELKNTTENTTQSGVGCKIIKSLDESNVDYKRQYAVIGDMITEWRSVHSDDKIIKAVKMSAGNSVNYVDGILRRWESGGYPPERKAPPQSKAIRSQPIRRLD
jgi:hypothetical protein